MTNKKLFYKYFIVIIFVGCLPLSVTWAQASSCADIFLLKESQRIESKKISDETIRSMIRNFAKLPDWIMDQAVEDHFIKTSPLYNKFKKNLSQSLDARSRVTIFLRNFVTSFLNPKKLAEERELSLAKQLQVWGGSEKSGYSQLKSLSIQNTHRVLQQFQLIPIEDLPFEIQEAVKNIVFEGVVAHKDCLTRWIFIIAAPSSYHFVAKLKPKDGFHGATTEKD